MQLVRNVRTNETGKFLYFHQHVQLGKLVVADWRLGNGAVYQNGICEKHIEFLKDDDGRQG